MAAASRAQGMRVAVPDICQPVAVFVRVSRSLAATGAMLSGPSGMSIRAPASSQLASIVSASGSGSANSPATRSSDSASAISTP